jgi:hypothetical protein
MSASYLDVIGQLDSNHDDRISASGGFFVKLSG